MVNLAVLTCNALRSEGAAYLWIMKKDGTVWYLFLTNRGIYGQDVIIIVLLYARILSLMVYFTNSSALNFPVRLQETENINFFLYCELLDYYTV